MLKNQALQFDDRAIEEAAMLEMETGFIVDRAPDLGGGDAAVGDVEAAKTGVFDVPFSTSPVQGEGSPGLPGAVRYLDHGNPPFTDGMIAFHKEKTREREKAVGKKLDNCGHARCELELGGLVVERHLHKLEDTRETVAGDQTTPRSLPRLQQERFENVGERLMRTG